MTLRKQILRKQIAAALKNEDVRVGERELPSGARLRGVYACRDFTPDDYVASFHGSVISREGLMALRGKDDALFEKINEYAVGHDPTGGHLYPEDLDHLGAHLINHSCAPNTTWGQYQQGAMLVRAIRPIAEGQEITVFYGWLGIKSACDKSWHPCACGAPFCAGTIELRVEWNDYGDGTCGPYLPIQEVARRLLADIRNDTDAHEGLVRRYPTGSTGMLHGAQVVAGIDHGAFFEKLQEGAHAAVVAALRLQAAGHNISERRLRQIVRAYDLLGAA